MMTEGDTRYHGTAGLSMSAARRIRVAVEIETTKPNGGEWFTEWRTEMRWYF